MRRKPITRKEVRVHPDFQIATMPVDSVKPVPGWNLVEAIEHLWEPLVAQLTKEQADYEASPRIQELRRTIGRAPLRYRHHIPWPRRLAEPCWHCGREFYLADKSLSRYCTNACSDAANAPARAANVAAIVKARSEARAKARAKRKCTICGKPIEAQRSTMRYCSARCRVAAHRRASASAPAE